MKEWNHKSPFARCSVRNCSALFCGPVGLIPPHKALFNSFFNQFSTFIIAKHLDFIHLFCMLIAKNNIFHSSIKLNVSVTFQKITIILTS